MAKQMGVLRLIILSFQPYLRSALGQWPLQSTTLLCHTFLVNHGIEKLFQILNVIRTGKVL